jgi:hypothetical protein
MQRSPRDCVSVELRTPHRISAVLPQFKFPAKAFWGFGCDCFAF